MERPAVTTIPGRPLKSAYDYIVVGAGSAGAAVTRSLVDAGADVLLIEAGPPGIGGGRMRFTMHLGANFNIDSAARDSYLALSNVSKILPFIRRAISEAGSGF